MTIDRDNLQETDSSELPVNSTDSDGNESNNQDIAGKSAPRRSTKPPTRAPRATGPAKRRSAKTATDAPADEVISAAGRRQRRTPLFPAATFEDALELAIAVYQFGAGQPVRRITLFDSLGKSPDSGPTRQLITNSSKYGLTTGSYSAEMLALTTDGLLSVADDSSAATKVRSRFKLAIEQVDIFKKIFDVYIDSRLPAHAVLMDKARDLGVPEGELAACIDTFTVNTKFVGVLRTISGAERLLSVDVVIDDYLPAEPLGKDRKIDLARPKSQAAIAQGPESLGEDYDTTCFYITPIGGDGSDQRKHSDLFMGSLVEPALTEFGLKLVRADKIGEAGMITAQIIQYLVYSKLVIVDLSFHNPNVFYELALRHAMRKPIVQVSRAADRLPFDVAQFRTIIIDTTDIYSLVPQLESLKAQIATQIRKTLEENSDVENPLSIFAPYFWSQLPS